MYQSLRRALMILMPTVLVGVASVGCKSELTGNEGNLLFSYVADDAITDFNKPIAKGARLDVEVREAGNRRLVTVTDASSDKPEILDIAQISGNTLVLEGKSDGNVLISVGATLQNGMAVTDSVNMNVRTPEVLKLVHSCSPSSPEGHYLVDDVFWLQFDMSLSNGQPVIGYGYFPITLEPADRLTLDTNARDQQWFHFTSGPTAGPVTLTSQIDSTTATLVLVEPGEIMGGEVVGNYGARVDIATWYYLRPTLADATPICQADTPMTVTSTTPEICEVTLPTERPDDSETNGLDEPITGGAAANETGWIRVVGHQVGFCKFDVVFTEGNAGAGATANLQVEIIDIVRPTNNGTTNNGTTNNGGATNNGAATNNGQ